MALLYILKKYKIVNCAKIDEKLKMIGKTNQNPEFVDIKLEIR